MRCANPRSARASGCVTLEPCNYMLPWMTADIDELDEVFGGDAWPYGIEPNRPTLEALVTYLSDQAIIKEPIPIDDLFVPSHGRYDRKTGRAA